MDTHISGHDYFDDLLIIVGLACFTLVAWLLGFAVTPWLAGITVVYALWVVAAAAVGMAVSASVRESARREAAEKSGA